MKNKMWLVVPIPELVLAIIWAVSEYFGNKKAGMNHHLKARRMQLWQKYYTPYGKYLIALLVIIALAYLIWVIWKQKEQYRWKIATTWQAALAVMELAFLLALLLGIWRKEILFSAYLIPGLYVVWILRLLFLRMSLNMEQQEELI